MSRLVENGIDVCGKERGIEIGGDPHIISGNYFRKSMLCYDKAALFPVKAQNIRHILCCLPLDLIRNLTVKEVGPYLLVTLKDPVLYVRYSGKTIIKYSIYLPDSEALFILVQDHIVNTVKSAFLIGRQYPQAAFFLFVPDDFGKRFLKKSEIRFIIGFPPVHIGLFLHQGKFMGLFRRNVLFL